MSSNGSKIENMEKESKIQISYKIRFVLGLICLIIGFIYGYYLYWNYYFFNLIVERYFAVGLIVLGGIFIFGDIAIFWLDGL